MKSRNRFKTEATHDNRHSKLWVKGINQMSSPWEEKALAVFQPDILITEQFLLTYRRRFYLQPEQELMLAILQDAVSCFRENLTAGAPRKQALFREAEEWLFSDDKSYFFSFLNICESVGLSPAYLLGGLIRWKEQILGELDRKQTRQQLAS
jgi:hypothetical protein